MKVASWVGLAGSLLVIWTGDLSAVDVARVQPMKLAAMEALYNGECGQDLVGVGVLKPDIKPGMKEDPMLFSVDIPYGLSVLANHDMNSFVPGINDLIAGVAISPDGDTINTVSYARRIEIGKAAQEALRAYGEARAAGNEEQMKLAAAALQDSYRYFGYGFLQSPEDAVPPVALTFYAFRIMVMAGGYLLLLFIVLVFLSYRSVKTLERGWLHWAGMLSIPVVWICSEAGWIVAEVGRQPWTIQDVLPRNVAISDVPVSSVQTTFWIFAAIFTLLLIAEVSIMLRYIAQQSKLNIEQTK